jgi:hypothetical protein
MDMREKINLRKIVLGLTMGLVSLTGCQTCKTEYSGIKTEKAIVLEKYHRNAYSTPVYTGKSLHMIYHSEVNRITFDGEIDFTNNDKKVYDQFNERDSAIVRYKDVYRAIYDDKDKDGIKELVSKKLIRYEFSDAVPK